MNQTIKLVARLGLLIYAALNAFGLLLTYATAPRSWLPWFAPALAVLFGAVVVWGQHARIRELEAENAKLRSSPYDEKLRSIVQSCVEELDPDALALLETLLYKGPLPYWELEQDSGPDRLTIALDALWRKHAVVQKTADSPPHGPNSKWEVKPNMRDLLAQAIRDCARRQDSASGTA